MKRVCNHTAKKSLSYAFRAHFLDCKCCRGCHVQPCQVRAVKEKPAKDTLQREDVAGNRVDFIFS